METKNLSKSKKKAEVKKENDITKVEITKEFIVNSVRAGASIDEIAFVLSMDKMDLLRLYNSDKKIRDYFHAGFIARANRC